MATMDSLPSDQRAVLELVLARGRSYDQIAKLLSIDRAAVRARALAALDALGPQTRVPAERRALITDYLLGALPAPVAEEVGGHLAQSAGERAWARVVASELESLAGAPLPEIPGAGAGAGAVAAAPRASVPTEAAVPEAAAESGRPREGDHPSRRVSRLGGAVLLAAGAALVVAVVLVLLLVLGSSSSKNSSNTIHLGAAATGTTTPPSTSTTATTATTPVQFLGQVNLRPPTGGKALGVAQVARQGSLTGVIIHAQGLAPNTTRPLNVYAVWLYNSASDSHLLGFVSSRVASNGRMQTEGSLPANASHYQRLLVTLEKASRTTPKSPGQIVLEGSLAKIKFGASGG